MLKPVWLAQLLGNPPLALEIALGIIAWILIMSQYPLGDALPIYANY